MKSRPSLLCVLAFHNEEEEKVNYCWWTSHATDRGPQLPVHGPAPVCSMPETGRRKQAKPHLRGVDSM